MSTPQHRTDLPSMTGQEPRRRVFCGTSRSLSICVHILLGGPAIFGLYLMATRVASAWILVAAFGGAWAACIFLNRLLRLELTNDGLSYRSAMGSWTARFDEIERASLTLKEQPVMADALNILTPLDGAGSHKLLRLVLHARGKNRLQMMPEFLPIATVSELLAALEEHSIPLDPPDNSNAHTLLRHVSKYRARQAIKQAT